MTAQVACACGLRWHAILAMVNMALGRLLLGKCCAISRVSCGQACAPTLGSVSHRVLPCDVRLAVVADHVLRLTGRSTLAHSLCAAAIKLERLPAAEKPPTAAALSS